MKSINLVLMVASALISAYAYAVGAGELHQACITVFLLSALLSQASRINKSELAIEDLNRKVGGK